MGPKTYTQIIATTENIKKVRSTMNKISSQINETKKVYRMLKHAIQSYNSVVLHRQQPPTPNQIKRIHKAERVDKKLSGMYDKYNRLDDIVQRQERKINRLRNAREYAQEQRCKMVQRKDFKARSRASKKGWETYRKDPVTIIWNRIRCGQDEKN